MEPLFSTGYKVATFLICTMLVIALGVRSLKWQRRNEIRAFSQRHGCRGPAKYTHEDRIWGSDMTRLRMEIEPSTFSDPCHSLQLRECQVVEHWQAQWRGVDE